MHGKKSVNLFSKTKYAAEVTVMHMRRQADKKPPMCPEMEVFRKRASER